MRGRSGESLAALARTGPTSGSTRCADAAWDAAAIAPRWRAVERSAVVGDASVWTELRAALHRWAVKTRSGFTVPDADATLDAGTAQVGAVQAGARLLVTARVGPFVVREPVEVVDVVDRDDRTGFAYATLDGHPIAGEEAFVLHRDGDAVVLTIRSLSRPAPRGPWRAAFPLLRAVQGVALRRYLRALGPDARPDAV